MFGAQPEPHALIPLATAGLALVVVSSGLWRPARNLLTLVHEAGHALIAVLVGRRLQGIRLHSDTSGVTVSRGKRTGPGMVLTSLAGYPAPAMLGLVFSGLIAADLLTMVLVVAAIMVLGVLVMVRNAYGVFTVLTVAVVLAVVAVAASADITAAFVYTITWFLLLGSVRPVFELQSKRRRGAARDSDADQLARLTGLPAALWVLVLGVLALGCLVVGGAWLLEPALAGIDVA
ncbi:MAG: M50 family metallopeptidase [Haloechinothrix sp.]